MINVGFSGVELDLRNKFIASLENKNKDLVKKGTWFAFIN